MTARSARERVVALAVEAQYIDAVSDWSPSGRTAAP
jgi:hypothetical protein